ncbi:glycerol-3-phosphate 1-O-acyltransferase PlsY [candidate division KSB1 bacterium]|nr:glycerol-3-phosphate 1-O-acyltransferase PlsY [candidate division KSB1 bacterium]
MFQLVSVILLSYLAGSFPTSIITGKLLKGIDIRQHGSGNAGGTNVFRVLGWKPGLFVMLFDFFKGFAATFWISLIASDLSFIDYGSVQLITGCCAILGHIWTVFANFHGGKGVGTAAGMLVALYPLAFIICLAVFFMVFFLTRIVSLGSMIAAVTLPLVLTIFRYALNQEISQTLYIFSFLVAVLIVFTHRSNIKRLLKGEENKFKRNIEQKDE